MGGQKWGHSEFAKDNAMSSGTISASEHEEHDPHLAPEETHRTMLTPEKRFRRTSALIAAGLVALAACCAAVYFAVAHSRYRVTGNIDPASGYRIEYTVSSRYRKLDKSDFSMAGTEMDSATFSASGPSAPMRWVDTYILHKPSVTSNLSGPDIFQFTAHGAIMGDVLVDSEGYPSIANVNRLGRIVSQKQSLISGCPSSWYTVEYKNAITQPKPTQVCYLIIRPRNRPVTYVFMGSPQSDREPDDVLREMVAIRNSIRIEKVH